MRAVLLLLAASAALLAVAACGGSDVDTPVPTPEEAFEPAEVAATDELAALPAPAAGLAFWSHPTLPFNSLVVAATSKGVIAYNIEDGAEVARIDGLDAGGIAITYQGRGATAQAIAAIYDRGAERFLFRAIGNVDRAFGPAFDPFAANDPVNGFCFGHARNEEALTLYVLGGRSLTTFVLSEDGAVEKTGRYRAPKSAAACVVDDVDGAVFVVTKDGAIYRFSNGRGFEQRFAAARAENAVSINLALNGLVVGGPTDQCCGQVAVLDAANGAVHLFDRDDGGPIGVVRLKAYDDVDGVSSATAMALGYGNYGGLYRAGAVALTTDGDAPALRLAAMNGVAHALGFTLGSPADPRRLTPQEEETVIDIDIVNP
ncbi:MAG: hypothetical protein ACE5FO_05010 [Parvularculaceae bacterium]